MHNYFINKMLTNDTLKHTYDKPQRDKFVANLVNSITTGKGTNADNYIKAGYNVKTRASAKAGACRLKKHPEVKAKMKKFKEYLEEFAPGEKRAKVIAKIALDTSDKRACLEGNKMISQIKEEYPKAQGKYLGLFDSLSSLEEQEPKEELNTP